MTARPHCKLTCTPAGGVRYAYAGPLPDDVMLAMYMLTQPPPAALPDALPADDGKPDAVYQRAVHAFLDATRTYKASLASARPSPTMRAVTLHQPHASAAAAGAKYIENRSKPVPRNLLGKRMLIHAGQGWDAKRAQAVMDAWIAASAREGWILPPPAGAVTSGVAHAHFPRGALLAEVPVLGCLRETARAGGKPAVQVYSVAPDDDRAAARVQEVCDDVNRGGPSLRWWIGPFGWVLDHDRILTFETPVPCPGAQPLGWIVPADVAKRVTAELDNLRGLT